jgi:hypothetical protein
MPMHLVERINASLAAEQAQRTGSASGAEVMPLRANPRRRRSRLAFAIAGAAAAVVVIGLVGTGVLTARNNATNTASSATSLGAEAKSADVPPNAAAKSGSLGPRLAATPAVLQIGLSGTRYTRAGFVAQVEALRLSANSHADPRPAPDAKSALGPAGTAAGLQECLDAIGAGGAQTVTADVAIYEGRPAVIIVATTNGVRAAYAVGPRCSRTDAAILRSATPLS